MIDNLWHQDSDLLLLLMTPLHFVAYGASALGLCFVVLSLACGLYYLTELVEEYTAYTRKVIKAMTATVMAVHILLLFDNLPFFHILFSLFCHCIYSLNLKTFPWIDLLSLPFLGSCLLVLVDHFLWFKYFTMHYRPFMDITAFFGICVWLIPLTYFISLSANENSLPMSDYTPPHSKKGLFKSLLSWVGIKGQDPVTAFPSQQGLSNLPPPSFRTHYNPQLHHRKGL